MSSDEDFSLVMDLQPSQDTLEGTEALITNYKKQHEQLLKEQQELIASRDDRQNLTKEFRQRTDKLTQSLIEDQRLYKEQMDEKQAELNFLKQSEAELMEEIRRVKVALDTEDARNSRLKQLTDVFTAVPEKTVVFTGLTGEAADAQTFEMKPRIVYPMEGGTALITFEEEVVAKNILMIKEHQVDLGGECSITVEARQVQLMMPELVELDTEVCPQRILISNLPLMETETLLNRLEIHFSKRRNGGGEVDECDMLPDSGTVVLAFVEKNIAKGLTDTENHEVILQNKKHRVRVTPFLNGKITNFKTKMTVCPRTVLVTGIPAVMEPENLQDLLEIHFQKSSNGGGEIEAFLYNALGHRTSALFEGVSSSEEEQE